MDERTDREWEEYRIGFGGARFEFRCEGGVRAGVSVDGEAQDEQGEGEG